MQQQKKLRTIFFQLPSLQYDRFHIWPGRPGYQFVVDGKELL